MSYYLLKIAITTALIVLVAEVSRRSSLAGAVLASVPVVSVLAMIWLYVDTGDVTQVSRLSRDIVWLVLPSLVLFLLLPELLERESISFPVSPCLSARPCWPTSLRSPSPALSVSDPDSGRGNYV